MPLSAPIVHPSSFDGVAGFSWDTCFAGSLCAGSSSSASSHRLEPMARPCRTRLGSMFYFCDSCIFMYFPLRGAPAIMFNTKCWFNKFQDGQSRVCISSQTPPSLMGYAWIAALSLGWKASTSQVSSKASMAARDCSWIKISPRTGATQQHISWLEWTHDFRGRSDLRPLTALKWIHVNDMGILEVRIGYAVHVATRCAQTGLPSGCLKRKIRRNGPSSFLGWSYSIFRHQNMCCNAVLDLNQGMPQDHSLPQIYHRTHMLFLL